jgi:prolyl oligopeptidase
MNIRHFIIINLAACLILSAFIAFAFPQNTPPKAEVSNVTDEYFGVKIVDPYRWMEDQKSEKYNEWLKAQDTYARTFLTKMPLRDEILKHLEELSRIGGDSIYSVKQAGGKYFYFKRAVGQNQHKLYVRDALTSAERVLVDLEKLSLPAGKRYTFDSFTPSPDGRHVAYFIFEGGSERNEMRIVETASGRQVDAPIDRISRVAVWHPDGKSIFVLRWQKLPPETPLSELPKKGQVYRHFLGTDSEKDTAVFGYGLYPDVEVEPELMPTVRTFPDSEYIFIHGYRGESHPIQIYAARLAEIEKGKAKWRKIVDYQDEVSAFTVHKNQIYLLTSKNSPRYKIIRTDAARPDLTKPKIVLASGESVVSEMAIARDALYVSVLDGGIDRLIRVDLPSGRTQPVKLPFDGAIYALTTNPYSTGALFVSTSWIKPMAQYLYDPNRQSVIDTNLLPQPQIDLSSIEVRRAMVESHDGTRVPLTILHKRGIKLDGKNPTLLYGYGAYGIPMKPFVSLPWLAWLERGGVYAVAHVRGGGEYGREWHLAGQKLNKPNSWKDFIACAEFLIREDYTYAKHLGAEGVSAGGILVGGAITERPDLFGAAILRLSLLNPLRIDTTENALPNITEYGTAATREGFQALLAMDAYHRVKDNTAYPAVLLWHGSNDPRVDAWNSAKMAARLQAATSSSKPVLLRINYGSGHGSGMTPQEVREERAEIFAFLFEQLK